MNEESEYTYTTAKPTHDDGFLWAGIQRTLLRYVPPPATVLELGCGNGVNARRIAALGYCVTAIDASKSAIAAARSVHSSVRFELASVYEPLHERFDTFESVVALEVIEHLYSPRALAHACANLLKPGGYVLVSTPYHGWLKNVLVAVSGRFDAHVNPLWEHGHIKFFSRTTIRRLLMEASLREVAFHRLGRIPVVAKSMLVVAQRAPV